MLHRTFNKYVFKITIDTGLIQTEFLDIVLNLPNQVNNRTALIKY